ANQYQSFNEALI
ncbi:hypothetical protein MK372_02425, partial [Streptococcus oralis]|nr:hypothetical protein [Streptococcus oralis]